MKIIKTLYNKFISKYPGCVNCAYFDDKDYYFMCNVCGSSRNFYMDKTFKTSIHIKNLKNQCYICNINLKKLCDDHNKSYCYDKLLRDHAGNIFLLIEKELKEIIK